MTTWILRLCLVLVYRFFFVCFLLFLFSCTAVLRDEPQNLEVLSTPPAALIPPPSPPVAVSLPPATTTFRAWIPREVFPNGDIVEGHYMEIGATPAVPETVPLPYTIPRVPKYAAPVGTPAAKVRQPPRAPEVPVAPEGLPGAMPPWVQALPGMNLPGGGTHGTP